MGCFNGIFQFKDFYVFLWISMGFLENLTGRYIFSLVITDQSQWKQLQVGSADYHRATILYEGPLF